MTLMILSLMLLIVVPLAFYTGTVLYKLHSQSRKSKLRTAERIDKIVESITTIAAAMSQQQCNLSEGSIRLCHLLDALPLVKKPDFSSVYTGVFCLYNDVKDLPTHDARKALSVHERKRQDDYREELEATLECQILRDVAKLKYFTV